MQYEGKLYGRIGNKYIPLRMNTQVVEELERDRVKLDWFLTADADQLNALDQWDRDSVDDAMDREDENQNG